ncbi:MAG: helicase associated domain-containing protein [Bacteroidota bacterium]
MVAELEALNFDWRMYGSKDMKWLSQYYELKNFKAQNGHINVPRNYEGSRQLANWARYQRDCETKMPAYRKKLLNEIGFLWKRDIERLKEQEWEEKFEELKKFKQKYGHCRVTAQKSSVSLSSWVQRIRHHKLQVSPQQIERLKAIEFMWAEDMIKFKEANWQEKYQELCQFKKIYGHCRIGGQSNEYDELKGWVSRQRSIFDKLPVEKKTLLNQIGLETSEAIRKKHEKSWMDKYHQLKTYHTLHGHCKVPAKYAENPSLGLWVRNQYKRPHQLNATQKKLLDELDFHWDGIKKTKQKWQERMLRLKQFKQKYGHCKVPQRWPEDRELGRWVQYCKEHRHTRLPASLIKQLDEIGFEWKEDRDKEREAKWLRQYQQLVEFKQQHGHTKPPHKHQLYQWTANQRNARYSLPANRRKLLDDINFTWKVSSNRSQEQLEKNWLKNYESLMQFKQKNSHLNPKEKGENRRLALWLFNQKKKFYNKMLPQEYATLLEQIGVEWNYRPHA